MWLFLEDIRTTAPAANAGSARADVCFDATNKIPVYFSNQGGWSGPFTTLTLRADLTAWHTVMFTNSGKSCLTVGEIWIRWPVNCTTNIAHQHAADLQVATNVLIPPNVSVNFTFATTFRDQSRDRHTWACWVMFEGIKTESVSPVTGESRVQLWLDGTNYTTVALNNQGQAETLQEAITWNQYIGNPSTIDPRIPHTVTSESRSNHSHYS